MDQVKLVMRQIVIHRFWVLSGLITVIGLVGWLMAVGSLLKEYDVNKGKIEGQYSAITAVRGVKNHPNDASHRKMDEIQNLAKQQVAQAWMQQYQQQVGVLVWPQRLQRDFEEAVIKLRPAEKIPYSDNYQQDIDKGLRSRYRDYIQEVLPQLATIIKSNWDAKAGAGGMGGMGGMAGPAGGGSGMSGFGGAMPGMGGPGGGAPSLLGGGGAAGGAGALPPQPNYVVQWNSGNQAAIVSRYDWSKQADNVPNTLQILYAQEDFWILTSLMNIIARTNEGADAPYKAAVKVIEAIDLGTYAQRSGAVTRVSGGGGGGGGMPGMPGMGGDTGGAAGGTTMVGGAAGGASSPPAGGAGGPGPGGASGGGMMPGMMGGGMGGGAARAADPLEGRYVDVNLQPVKADTMRQALEVRTPQDALLAVVKRMPVRLQLTVDIRKLNRLLAECGNAQLPLEVRQVRINRQSGGGGSMGGGGMMGGGMGGGDMGGFSGKLGSGSGATTPGAGAPSLGAGPGAGDGMSAGGGMGGMGGGGSSGPLVATAESYEIKVEIFGLVYIYNPPNEKILGALQVPENAGPAASASPTTTSSVGASNPSRS